PEYFPDSIWFDDFPRVTSARTIALDPSKGRDSKSGDYAAFALLAITADGTLWVEGDLFRGQSAEYLADVALAHCRHFHPDALSVETNQFQQLFASIIDLKARVAGQLVPIVQVNNTVAKQVRIRRLGPYLAQGRLRFRNTPGTRLLVQQLQEFPVGPHDDGPDALEMALRALGGLMEGTADEEDEATILDPL
ncbi:MAG TPA: phage terminase large subunit, partial [Gemmataceae bacterium]|nr:phage terminase large subunit [Gemmataceae bacterium]